MTPFLATCITIALALLVLALCLSVYRVLRGPTRGDRIVAIDLFGVLAVALIALFAIWMDRAVFLDAAIALALVAFFGTVAYARFVEDKAARNRTKEDGDE
ncbi:monovalent cation/H+ antiporter complex subunit F [Niveispirillum sp. KHB5.9]|uniref:monovalent cation/H+ antiporter complex subunit F n=1 Tax=Niveispirillum sp. KHB5.9 TaxID=3400269 RepID=UPI003A83D4CA